MQFLPGSGGVDTAIWMHYMDSKKWLEKKLDGNYTRMLREILNKSWRQHPTTPTVRPPASYHENYSS